MARERKRLGRYLNNSSIVHKLILIINNVRGMAQLVARLSGGQEAVSSSLATPTKQKKDGLPSPYKGFFREGCPF